MKVVFLPFLRLANVGKAKVNQLNKLLMFVEKHVLRLQVTVNYVQLVQVVQREQALTDDHGDSLLRELLLLGVQLATLEILGHQVNVLVVQIDLVQLDYVWMVDCEQDTQLFLQFVLLSDNTLPPDRLHCEVLARVHRLEGDPHCAKGPTSQRLRESVRQTDVLPRNRLEQVRLR